MDGQSKDEWVDELRWGRWLLLALVLVLEDERFCYVALRLRSFML